MWSCGQGGGRNWGASRRDREKGKKIAGPEPCHEILIRSSIRVVPLQVASLRCFPILRLGSLRLCYRRGGGVDRALGPSSQDLDRSPACPKSFPGGVCADCSYSTFGPLSSSYRPSIAKIFDGSGAASAGSFGSVRIARNANSRAYRVRRRVRLPRWPLVFQLRLRLHCRAAAAYCGSRSTPSQTRFHASFPLLPAHPA